MPNRKFRINKDSWTTLRDILVGTPEDFNTDRDTLRGRTIQYNAEISWGRIPEDERTQMRESVVRYVIYSYGTPIAWRRVADWNRDGTPNYEWVVPNVRYSVTTSKHQGKVATAISQIGN